MKAVVFSDKTSADAIQAKIDAAYGYPRDGVDIGGGIHVHPSLSRTLHAQAVIAHPDGKQFAAVTDDVDSSKLAAQDKTAVDAAVTLDATWFAETP